MSAPRSVFTVRTEYGIWYDASCMIGCFDDAAGYPYTRESLAAWVRKENRRLALKGAIEACLQDMDTDAGDQAVRNAVFFGSSGRFILKDVQS